MFQIQVSQQPGQWPPGLQDLSVGLEKSKMRKNRKLVSMSPVLDLLEDIKSEVYIFNKTLISLNICTARLMCLL